MDQSKVTVRYAKAFFGLAKENKQLDELKKDIDLVFSIINSSADFVLLLESPVVKTSQKAKAVQLIFKGKVNEATLNFLTLIIENKREVFIPGICRNFIGMYRKEQGVKTAVITSATELAPSTAAEIKKILGTEFKANVEMSEKVNGNLIGGFILRVDDNQYDASIATQLKKVKETLLNTEIK